MIKKLVKNRIVIGLIAIAAVVSGIWIYANPPGRFGVCAYAFTTYGGIPDLVSDCQIRADGTRREVEKTHALMMGEIQWLLESEPEHLIIATGWHGVLEPAREIVELDGPEIHVLKNDEAIKLFNRLKKEGAKVAIHYHSTC